MSSDRPKTQDRPKLSKEDIRYEATLCVGVLALTASIVLAVIFFGHDPEHKPAAMHFAAGQQK